MKSLYIYTRYLFPNFLIWLTLACISLLNSLHKLWNLEYITISIMVVFAYFPKYLDFTTLSSERYHNIFIDSYNFQQLPKYMFENVPIVNFNMFFDICEGYTYTLYERSLPLITSAQILDSKITNYVLNLKKHHSTIF